MRTDQDITNAMDTYGDAVWRVCILHFKNTSDAEDAFQETFIKYATNDAKTFESEEHRKAWLIRVASNQCKDMLRSTKKRAVPIGGDSELSMAESDSPAFPTSASESTESRGSEIVDAIRSLTDPPRTPVYLSLYEGYSAVEIASIMDAPVTTVYSWISRGKKSLREALR